MGLIKTILGLGRTVQSVSEVFVPNKTKSAEQAYLRFETVQAAYASEASSGAKFDQWVNALNRLPRPVMALGTVGLFVFAMVDPIAFAGRMEGLSYVPEPLWWLLGAVVSFYFGARELHHFRAQKPVEPIAHFAQGTANDANAALEEWVSLRQSGPDWLDE